MRRDAEDPPTETPVSTGYGLLDTGSPDHPSTHGRLHGRLYQRRL
jgi:hypothetical protein